ncbi:tRNA (adenosine(37)-N6)-dimethylallyltransferase MiaA [Fructobacillus sp. M1-13]|uniref:tRNA dimethylallyltransferase n=1 Tax=Fructobacillus papyriferae TaxID=2713171 RepID=A0ABS5QMX4_9LACO|nr:tRNA (adenosine(37)-N6)-dimethylallyltransferase MiaA [Fructobacillus papyriferae]MBS9334423.1 tRNA (adenosine(37)-N6)-dimethylallyltransferase MiaA [Fructobacillus papyriferae]MCD2158412.1 tRNA (adenosine(37)-N6)-dimethylallyltransferase MiaA [Fructobacillus papyriferae]
MDSNQLIVIAGPTASGKSSLAMDLAEQFNGEIVSADSMQVYKDLDIGTAKADAKELARGPQWLLDLVDMKEQFSVADFVKEADQAIAAIRKRGKLPIVVGGTGFYVKALLGQQKLDFAPSNEEEQRIDAKRSLTDLVDELKKIADENLFKRVDLKNKARVLRALQIARHGKKTEEAPKRPIYNALVLGLDWPREKLYERINDRVLVMLEKGLENEARALYDAGGLALQAGRGIGYKEFYPYFEGTMTKETVIFLIQQDSRRYAKRQLTYWRHQIEGLEWIDGQKPFAEAVNRVTNFLEEKDN